MLKSTLRLDRQNILYIMLKALACLSLVEKYECFGETLDLHPRNAPYIVHRTLACFGLARKNILSIYALEQNSNSVSCTDQYSRSVPLHDPAGKQLLSHNG